MSLKTYSILVCDCRLHVCWWTDCSTECESSTARRSKFNKLEEARSKIIDIAAVCAGLAVMQDTLVAFRRLPCARGRVS